MTERVTRVEQPNPLTEADLAEIEAEARTNAAETYRGPLLALIDEVRRLRSRILEGGEVTR